MLGNWNTGTNKWTNKHILTKMKNRYKHYRFMKNKTYKSHFVT